MKNKINRKPIRNEVITNKIFVIRDQKVILDYDLAALYGVATKVLNQAVKRNAERFPKEFMFRLTKKEWADIRSQIVTASQNRRNEKILPFAFNEHGLVMIANVLKSPKAIKTSIAIIKAFVQLRKDMLGLGLIAKHIQSLRSAVGKHDVHLARINEVMETLLSKVEAKVKEQKSIELKIKAV